jgi:hypothetical protein
MGGLILSLIVPPTAVRSRQQPSPVVINEVLVDPASGLEGDANGDGIRDTYHDEFIEVVNRGPVTVDISGWETGPAGSDPFRFPAGTLLAPGEYAVVFGGGVPVSPPGQAFTADGRLGSGLTNTGGRLLLIDPAGADTIQDISWEGWDTDGSWTRVPEGWGPFAEHATLRGTPFSPGGPALPGGGPDSSLPEVYRLRTVNLTSAGYEVAWRSGTLSNGRLEVRTGGAVRHCYDRNPSGVLHMAGIYGLDPLTDTSWRVVSGGTISPVDTFLTRTTAPVSISIPFTVHGTLLGGVEGAPVPAAHVFLRAGSAAGRSAWLAAVSDSTGRWQLNLGNLRGPGGDAWTWSAGDTLFVDADGAGTGIAATAIPVGTSSPQEIPLPVLLPDPAPQFSWQNITAPTTADSSITLGYSLADPGGAWARVFLRADGEVERHPAATDPSLLSTGAAGSVEIDLRGLPEGTLWWIGAVVEDGLNPPCVIEADEPIRIAHATGRYLDLVCGVELLTPTLDDPDLRTAHDWLDRLPGAGELARWDVGSAAWISAVRLADGTIAGGDFTLEPGTGYALVNTVAGTLRVGGPRRYAPDPVVTGTGLVLIGVSDSSAVRSAGEVLADPAIVAVSGWNRQRQAWEGLFRRPDGGLVGDDFTVGWGDAVAIDVDTITTWQPSAAGPGRAEGDRTVGGSMPRRSADNADHGSLLAVEDGRQAVRLYWNAPPAASVSLERRNGTAVWLAPSPTGSGWQTARVTGLAEGWYRAVLRMSGPEGDRIHRREIEVIPGGLPQLPEWVWGPAPDEVSLLVLEQGGALIPVHRDGGSGWYGSLSRGGRPPGDRRAAMALVGYAGDGGWTRWPLEPAADRSSLTLFVFSGPPLSVSGIEVEEEGPLALTLGWQVLDSGEPLLFQPSFGYASGRGGNGPPGDPRTWRDVSTPIEWEPGGNRHLTVRLSREPGPEGQAGPEAVAVCVGTESGERWLGPAALPVVGPAREVRLLPAVPNPFNPETLLRYTLPEGGDHAVRLEVRDVRGRLTRRLVDRRQPGGTWQARWDGTDRSGARAAAGIYLVILEVDGVRATRKVILLK